VSRSFLVAFAVGFALVAALAYVYPLPGHERYRSLITVLPNGGRQEDFVIRWPADRIATGPHGDGEVTSAGAPGVLAMDDAQGHRASAEVFRLRDAKGNVIGLASRVAALGLPREPVGVSTTSWLLLIPSRGALLLRQVDSANLTAVEDIDADGVTRVITPVERPGFWSLASSYRITNGPDASGAGVVVEGTDEFGGLAGSYVERWELGPAAAGQDPSGQIVLTTLLRSAD